VDGDRNAIGHGSFFEKASFLTKVVGKKSCSTWKDNLSLIKLDLLQLKQKRNAKEA